MYTSNFILGWPIIVVVCGSLSLAIIYLVTHTRSNHKQFMDIDDDVHNQMEWEDDIGLNIIVNPLNVTEVS